MIFIISNLLKKLGLSIFRQRVVIFRFFTIIFLCAALFLAFSYKNNDVITLETEQESQSYTEQTGIGGIMEESLFPENDGVMEPESFSKPQVLLYSIYKIQKGDIIGVIAANFGLNADTLISVNNIKNARQLQIGQNIFIPNQDGIIYSVKRGDTLEQIAKKYNSEITALSLANELLSDNVLAGSKIFIPGAKLDWMERQEVNGDLFIWPVSGYITSPYGYRISPFGGARQFHSGIDIAARHGTPIRAAMAGRVNSAGWDNTLGNFVVITHHSGYRSLYGHLSVIRVKSGAYVGTGERIGDVGSTGLSTGSHLHFTVYKNGVTINPRSVLK